MSIPRSAVDATVAAQRNLELPVRMGMTLIDDEGLSARIGADHLGHSRVSETQDTYMARGRVHKQVADLLGVRRLAVARWEAGNVEPREPHRQAYIRLLAGLAVKYPTAVPDPSSFPE